MKSPLLAILSALVVLVLNQSCQEAPNYPDEPEIVYMGLSKADVLQGRPMNPNDTLTIMFSFTDGDGNLGSNDSLNVFLTDSRDGFRHTFKIDKFETVGAANGISGEVELRLPNKGYFCCTFPVTAQACIVVDGFPTDTLIYEIQVRDENDNYSNVVRTDPIVILCQ